MSKITDSLVNDQRTALLAIEAAERLLEQAYEKGVAASNALGKRLAPEDMGNTEVISLWHTFENDEKQFITIRKNQDNYTIKLGRRQL